MAGRGAAFVTIAVVGIGLLLPFAISMGEKGMDKNLQLVPGEPRRLRLGQTAENLSEGIALSFESVVEDSRCPEGARCVWEGNARVVFRFETPRGAGSLELNTSSRFERELSRFGWVVRLVDLAPAPRADSAVAPAEYVVAVAVSAAPSPK
jgi:hypothetical protein